MSLTREECRARLQTCADTITQEAIDMWWEHATKHTSDCVSQLLKALPCLAELNRVYRQEQPLLSWLVDRVWDSDVVVRSAGAKALGGMSEKAATSEVLSALIVCLRDRERSVRSAAAEALGKMGEKAATQEFLSTLVESVQVGREYAPDAVKILQKFHQHKLRLCFHKQGWTALTIWRLARGERVSPTPLPLGWQEPVLSPAGMRVWVCGCQPPRVIPIVVGAVLNVTCNLCGQPYRPVNELS